MVQLKRETVQYFSWGNGQLNEAMTLNIECSRTLKYGWERESANHQTCQEK